MFASAFFLTLSLLSAATTTTQTPDPLPYNATDLIFLNCGGSSDFNIPGGKQWKGDAGPELLSSNPQNASLTSTASVQDSSVPRVPFITARIFRSEITYSFQVSLGPKFVRLYFYPVRYGSDLDAASSFFSVTANGFTLMKNFSAYLVVNASDPPVKSLIKEFIVPVWDSETLNLTFTPSQNSSGFVNGIEIVSLPAGLYTGGGRLGVRSVDGGGSIGFDIGNTTAFETLYRLNVGGTAVADVDDTGMYRAWRPDSDYISDAALGVTPYRSGVPIRYTRTTPAYVAPQIVYATSRTMGNAKNPRLNLNYNLTWGFIVDTGFNYLLRLHFCETQLEVTKENQRVFAIFIENQTARIDADVIQLSGGSGFPVYLDFVLLIPSRSDGIRDLRLDLHPYMDTGSEYADAILNGLEILKLNNSDGSLFGPNPELVIVGPPSPEPGRSSPGRGKDKGSKVLTVSMVVLGCTLGLSFLVFVVFFLRRKKRQVKDHGTVSTNKTKSSWGLISGTATSTNTNNTSSLPSDLCRRFTIVEARAATGDFDDEFVIGIGGFGKVYKSRMDGGARVVAVKRLDPSSHQGAREFETEVEMLSKLRHMHLVSLIGYCDDENEMILVYDYMPHGTLKDHLYKKDNPPLTWKRRLEICIGAARGLQYLHSGVKHPIIHRDIKSTNILLDENWVAKVSDFGLSKVGPVGMSQTHVSTMVKGSVGYIDPEYYRRQQLTDKSDVYSFGVVLFEVLCARPASIQGLPKGQVNLAQWAKLNHSRGTIDQIIDPHLKGDVTSVSLNKFSEIAARCVHDRGIERPTMNDIVWALEFALQLHETAEKNNTEGEALLINVRNEGSALPRGEVGTTDDDEDLFSRSRGHVSESTSTDEGSLLQYDRDGSSSNAVFSEIGEPKGR